MFGFFNIVLDMKPYQEDESRLRTLANNLRACGIKPVDVREAPIVEDSTGKEVAMALILKCKETRLFAKNRYKNACGFKEIEYEGLPTLM